jgi:hypothetical protein
VNIDLCIFCQSFKRNENLREVSSQEKQTIKYPCLKRKQLRDINNIEIIERLEKCFKTDVQHSLVWHKSCYTVFTDKNKMQRLQTKSENKTGNKFPIPKCTPVSPSLRKANKMGLMHVLSKGETKYCIKTSDDKRF